MAFELPSNPLGCPDATELGAPRQPSRRLHYWSALLCVVLSGATAATTSWIADREAATRLAAVERGLLAADAHAVRLVALADAIMLPALWAIDGRDPALLSFEQLSSIRRVALETVPGRFSLDIWQTDGTSALAGGIDVSAREDFRFQAGSDRAADARRHLFDANRRLFVSAPQPEVGGGEATIYVSRPVIGGNGQPKGVVSVGIPVASFVDIYMALLDREEDRIALYRADRTLLAQYPPDGPSTVQPPGDALWRHYPDAKAGRFEVRDSAGGPSMLNLYSGLDPLPLVVVYALEWNARSGRALLSYWPLLAIAAATLAAAVVYAWMSIRYANALHRTNAELARTQDGLRLEAEGRGVFIANMNHELRTPLNAIVGFAQILAGSMFGPLGHPKYREYARDIVDSGKHLLMLIGDIIDFSAIDIGSRTLELVPLDAGEAIEDLARLLRPVAGERGVVLRATGQPLWVRADAVAVRQILMNLVSNAIKFAPHGSVVDLADTVDSAAGMVALTVADCGPGIAPEEIPSIGRPFYRTRDSRERAVPGTGLGLSISTALAHKMGGRLTLASVPGRGTTVTLLLPPAGPPRILPA